MTMHGDTVRPRGKYLVALNEPSIDRFNPVGPLHPQNHQLIDISDEKMQLPPSRSPSPFIAVERSSA